MSCGKGQLLTLNTPHYSLPPGSFRCPLRRYGFDVRESTPEAGPGVFFKRQAASLQYPRVWKGLTKTKDPFVVVVWSIYSQTSLATRV